MYSLEPRDLACFPPSMIWMDMAVRVRVRVSGFERYGRNEIYRDTYRGATLGDNGEGRMYVHK